MKIFSILAVAAMILVPVSTAVLTPDAVAQSSADAMPACSGAYNIVRISELKDGATMDQFMAAVQAQQAWYKSHGSTDVVFAAKIMGTSGYSERQVMTYHYSKTGAMPSSAHDAAWTAFVKLFSDSSTIKETYINCVPAEGLPAGLQ